MQAGFLPLLSLPVGSLPIELCDHIYSKPFSQVVRLSAMTKYLRETLQKADECIRTCLWWYGSSTFRNAVKESMMTERTRSQELVAEEGCYFLVLVFTVLVHPHIPWLILTSTQTQKYESSSSRYRFEKEHATFVFPGLGYIGIRISSCIHFSTNFVIYFPLALNRIHCAYMLYPVVI